METLIQDINTDIIVIIFVKNINIFLIKMETLIQDINTDVILSLSLNELRNYCQMNKNTYHFCKTNGLLNDKFKYINHKINDIIQIVSHRDNQDFYINTIIEYDFFDHYKKLMDQLQFKSFSYNPQHVDDYQIIKMIIGPTTTGFVFNYVLINDEDDEKEYTAFSTLSQTKEFLLQLYFDQLIF